MQHDLQALSDERDVQLELRLAAYREGWMAGYMTGAGRGRRAEAAERDAEWNAIARPVARGRPAHAEFERKRWALRGQQRTRETFGDPHPGDYPGRGSCEPLGTKKEERTKPAGPTSTTTPGQDGPA